MENRNTSRDMDVDLPHRVFKLGQTVADFKDFDFIPIHSSTDNKTIHIAIKDTCIKTLL